MAPPKKDHGSSGSKAVTHKLKKPSPSKMKSKGKEVRLLQKKMDGPFVYFYCLRLEGFAYAEAHQFSTEDKALAHTDCHKEEADAKPITLEKARQMLKAREVQLQP